jgi:hypothetical protein
MIVSREEMLSRRLLMIRSLFFIGTAALDG